MSVEEDELSPHSRHASHSHSFHATQSSHSYDFYTPREILEMRKLVIAEELSRRKREKEIREAVRDFVKQREEAKKRRRLTKSVDCTLEQHMAKLKRKITSRKLFIRNDGEFVKENSIFYLYKPGFITEATAKKISEECIAKGWTSWTREIKDEGWWIFVSMPELPPAESPPAESPPTGPGK